MNAPSNKSKQKEERAGARGARLLTMPSRPTGEEELVAGLIARRPTAVQSLYGQYAVLVRRVLIYALGSDRDVEDFTQDTLITVIERAPALRKAQSLREFCHWRGHSSCQNEIRRRAVRRFVGLEEVLEAPLVLPHDAAAAQGARHIYRALDRLNVTGRMAFVLHFVHGCELAETAEACGCSRSTIKRKLARAEAQFSALVQADPVLRELLRGSEGIQ